MEDSARLDAKTVAHELLGWAKKNNLIANFRSSPEFDERLINDVLSPVGLRAAGSILENRGITYIGVNEEENSVQIFLAKSPRVRDVEAFAKAGRYGVPISIMGGGTAYASRNIPPPINANASVYRGDRYSCGSSVYLASETGAGTMGCLLKDKAGNIFGLSNNHVTGGCNYAELTLPISAPGQLDIQAGGRDPFTIGNHYAAMPFTDGIPSIVDCSKNIDAAIFLIKNPDLVTSFQRDSFDTPAAIGGLSANMNVMKCGRSSGLTRGKVVSHLIDPYPVIYDVPSINGKKVVYFEDGYLIKDDLNEFARNGDSGSIIVTATSDENKVAVGIVVATDGDKLTYAISLDRVLEYFQLSIVSGHNV